MHRPRRPRLFVTRVLPVLVAAMALAGCASADKTNSATTSAAASSGSSQGRSTASSGMAGMNMGTGTSTSASSVSAGGIKPVPIQILGSALWQGMKITAEVTTPVPFVVYNGTSEQMVKPTPKTSFHLMIMLSDAQTNVAIPYASVWATITHNGKIDFDERQWPMISRYMGPHYGNDVSLPGAGEYKLSLLVSPPVSARHVEYENVWLHPHRVNFAFHWAATT